jgi:hypothetical protein
MSVSKVRLLAIGSAAAALVAVATLTGARQSVRNGLQASAAEPGALPAKPGDGKPAGAAPSAKPVGGVHVEAPSTAVNVDKDTGHVSVTAPYTDVKVDPDKGRVQVHAPYVNLDIHW